MTRKTARRMTMCDFQRLENRPLAYNRRTLRRGIAMTTRVFRAALVLGLCVAPELGQAVVYRGLAHTPLGAANLTITPANELIVSNIGSSGNDGVSIDLGRAVTFEIEYRPIQNPRNTASRAFTVHGQVAGNPGVLVGRL